jgi:hypothetical protein
LPLIENNVDLQPFNTFGLPSRASRRVLPGGDYKLAAGWLIETCG